MKEKTTAIVVTYNPDILTLERQFFSLSTQVDSIIYIDNSSANIEQLKVKIDYFKTQFEEIHIILNHKNIGLAAAQNQGINLALQSNAFYVLILDHDSIIDKNLVLCLIEEERLLSKDGIKVGAVGPVYYDEINGETYPITKYIGPFIKRVQPTTSSVEASFLISSGCLIRTDVLNVVGLMNEDLFIDYIDVDWSFRAVKEGYKLFSVPTARMRHIIGDRRLSIFGRTISVHSPLRRYYLCRNSIYMAKRHYIPVGYKIREIAFILLRLLVFFFASKERKKYLKYCFRGFSDGFKCVGGECSFFKVSKL